MPLRGFTSVRSLTMKMAGRQVLVLVLMASFFNWLTSWIVMSPVAAQEKPQAGALPNVAGEWTGTWGPYAPQTQGATDKQRKEMRLDCSVVRKDGSWQATFEGECGRPYKYTIKMEGRQAGDVVLFKGTTDLGEKDGGVYDWIGRATDKEFIGFYTSAKYSGVFRLSRKAGDSGR